jgi:hypothetical protein
MYRSILILFIITGILAAFLISLASGAWTMYRAISHNAFDTGSIVIDAQPTKAMITYADMAPGDAIARPLVIANRGSLRLRYAFTSESDDDGKHLAQALQLIVRSGTANCTADATDGELLYAGPLATATFGDATPGAQPGDRVLEPGAFETLCFTVQLPVLSDNNYQVATTTAIFYFLAEQTAHNGPDLPTATPRPSQTPTATATHTATATATPTPGAPGLSQISPASAKAGSPGLTLTVTGANYTRASVVQWNGSDLSTTWVSATQLSVQLPAAALATVGVNYVSVRTPGSASDSPFKALYVTETGASVLAADTETGNSPEVAAALAGVTATASGQGTLSGLF